LEGVFFDGFEREVLGDDYYATGNGWYVEDGQVCGEDVYNHPLWLRRRLPVNARVEFVVSAGSRRGDLKVEVWGDGRSHARGVSYTDATGYVFILGGWSNERHVLARLNEHGRDRLELAVEPGAVLPRAPVEPGRAYRMVVERRDGRTVHWRVDGVTVFTLEDAEPLAGAGHEHFAFGGWRAPTCFDDLSVTPLPEA
jgi:hypothetical protein